MFIVKSVKSTKTLELLTTVVVDLKEIMFVVVPPKSAASEVVDNFPFTILVSMFVDVANDITFVVLVAIRASVDVEKLDTCKFVTVALVKVALVAFRPRVFVVEAFNTRVFTEEVAFKVPVVAL